MKKIIQENEYNNVILISDLIRNDEVVRTWSEITCTGILDQRFREKLNTLEEELYMFSFVGKSMREMLAEMGMGGSMAPSQGEPMMMVATTEDSRMGASVIQYPGFLEEATEKMGRDFFILPSSIHEVILVPDDGSMNQRELAEMVRSINEAQVAPPEQLSNNVYHYDQKDRIFELADKTADRKRAQESEKSTDRKEPFAKKSSVLEQLGEKKKEAK